MKKEIAFVLFAACGDNITPLDAGHGFPPFGIDGVDDVQGEVGCETECEVADAGVTTPDAAVVVTPDADTCDDSHIDLNGHEHKCQHDQTLPSP